MGKFVFDSFSKSTPATDVTHVDFGNIRNVVASITYVTLDGGVEFFLRFATIFKERGVPVFCYVAQK